MSPPCVFSLFLRIVNTTINKIAIPTVNSVPVSNAAIGRIDNPLEPSEIKKGNS